MLSFGSDSQIPRFTITWIGTKYIRLSTQRIEIWIKSQDTNMDSNIEKDSMIESS